MKLDLAPVILSFLVLRRAAFITAQNYTGCHSHGDVEYAASPLFAFLRLIWLFRYCSSPDGEETPMAAVDTVASTALTRVRTTSPAAITSPASLPTTPAATFQITAVTDCHKHSTQT